MNAIAASMAGIVIRVNVQVGDAVQPGQDVVVLESMKMEIPVQAEAAGTVRAVNVKEGDFVNEGDVLVELEG
ncbi:acetyl-CoA carboxylase biotin carboxyl carrier protein subunit [Calditerricola satsumensis]|nr:acetyl-CoA carboxylase biotin carboxyl carrier protein subunit [Calditerricola satsumensis]